MVEPSRVQAGLLGAALAALTSLGCDTVPSAALEDCDAVVSLAPAVTDILFVIDDSTSMGDEQVLLRAGLDRFIQTLTSSPIANDFQIGVTTTSVLGFYSQASYSAPSPSAGIPYAAGTIVAIEQDASGNPVPGKFIYASGAYGGARILPAASQTLVRDFGANVLVGVDGSLREQPFSAARRALEKSGRGGENEGFLRPGARLALVFLSDEDDCSGPTDTSITDSAGCRAAKAAAGSTLMPVSELDAFLRGPLAGELRDVLVAAIVGVDPATLEPSCGQAAVCSNTACSTAADKGDRFVELLAAIGPQRTRLASICDASFDAALAGIADMIMPQRLALEGAPADWRMLVAHVERAGVSIPCRIARRDADPSIRDAADAVYDEGPPALTFQNACALEPGDRVVVDVVCAG